MNKTAKEPEQKIQSAKPPNDEVDEMLAQAWLWYCQRGKLANPPAPMPVDEDEESEDGEVDEEDWIEGL